MRAWYRLAAGTSYLTEKRRCLAAILALESGNQWYTHLLRKRGKIMKRDLDLIRHILLEIEKEPYTGDILQLDIEGYTPEQINYHILLLADAGLIEVMEASYLGRRAFAPIRLTWEGHEFLEAT